MMKFLNIMKKRYRQLVSIECPRSYEPRALPLRHAGFKMK